MILEYVGPPPATETVDVIVPVLHRPQNVRPLMESLRASTGLATAWFVVEENDLIEAAEAEKYGAKVLWCSGTYAQKVNHAYTHTTAPWLLPVGDDVIFRPGWLDYALKAAGDGRFDVIGTNDLGNPRVIAGDHATHMLIRRTYVDDTGASWDGPGVVCHTYGHWFVDDEIVTAAKQRGRWVMARDSVIEHAHPAWGKGPDDEIYALGQSRATQDQQTFIKRLRANGG